MLVPVIECGRIQPRPVRIHRRRRAKEFVESRSDTITDVPGPFVEAFPVPLAILGLRTKGGLVAVPLGLQALVAKVLLAVTEVGNTARFVSILVPLLIAMLASVERASAIVELREEG
jgi:hypothetical protein